MTRLGRIAALAGRIVLAAFVLGVFAVVGVQFEGIVAKNFALAADVRASDATIAALGAREIEQRQTIARLGSARGAIPEIHEKLHLVGPNEEIIYVRGAAPLESSGLDGSGTP